jgi:hypothetical protein
MNICCPKCASSDGKSIEAIYCECRTPGRERPEISEDLSRQSAPPLPRRPVLWLSLSIVFAAMVIAAFSSSIPTATAFAACAALSAWMAREAVAYNRSDLPRLLEYWHRSFICTRCGEVFVPLVISSLHKQMP